MKHLLHIVAGDFSAQHLLVIDPVDASLVYSQPLQMSALDDLIQADTDAMLASLMPDTFDKPGRESKSSTMLLGRDSKGRMLFATSVVAASWDGTNGNSGYGSWRTCLFRYRIVEVTSIGVIPVSVVNRLSTLKYDSGLPGYLKCFDGVAYFIATNPSEEANDPLQIISLDANGVVGEAQWNSGTYEAFAFIQSGDKTHLATAQNAPI